MDYSLQYDDAMPDAGSSSFSFITPYFDAFFAAQVISFIISTRGSHVYDSNQSPSSPWMS